METGQNAGSVIIIEQLAAEFQIQLAAEFRDTLLDLLRLQTEVFVIVKTYLVHVDTFLYGSLQLKSHDVLL